MKKDQKCVCHLGVFSQEEFKLHKSETASLLEDSPFAIMELEDGFSFTYEWDVILY